MLIRLTVAPRRLRGAVFFILNALAFLLITPLSIFAQHDSAQTPFVAVSGTVTLSEDIYDFKTTPDGIEVPRRPPNLTRLVFAPTITIGDYISLPFNIQLSSRETNFITSSVPNPTFVQFIENPLNNLGFISFSPKIGWAKAFIGTHTPMYSELSTGDQQIFGGGFDLTPGKFELAASTGIAQRAIEPDSAHGIKGAYARTLSMAKIGFGNPDSSCFAINLLRMKDDPNSILIPKSDSTAPQAQEGALASMNFGIQAMDALRITGEAAVSGFTMDLNSTSVDIGGGIIPQSILAQRISTRADVAGTLVIDWKEKTWGIKTSGKYIGAGFVTPGYPYLTPDRLEFLVAPRVALFSGGLALNASLGYRVNNLSQTKAATSTQIIGSATALATFSDAFSISGQFANFGVKNSETNDTLKIQSVANSFSVTPTYVLTGSTGTHNISVTYSLDVFNDYNTITGALASNNTRNIQGLYSASWSAIPLSTTFIVSSLLNHLPSADLTINSMTLELDYALADIKLTPIAQATYSEGTTKTPAIAFSPDIQRQLRAGLKWQIAKQITLRMTGTTTGFTYGGTRPGESFRESLLESSIGVQF
ncbi:MAG: hypothetical protein Q8922_12050 [Bacteroidota bacterium]|nr:hypothetical protein [Bacteroidota bacterium]MDP4233314.1 hypothetical protein [Bacteroidota bacterium]MDP4242066.1 hypothetical protein [Bacteroidota bacterium]MDP4288656.1 hypothetical protein [Bacteroidota bacterium]